MGVEAIKDGDAARSPCPTATWLHRLAPGAAATIAIGTCATWGGVPSAEGNPTGAMSVMDSLGKDYRSAFGLPVINIPGCAPQGDNFTETVFAILLFLQGLGPLPTFDELGRPGVAVPARPCTRAARAPASTRKASSREHYGDPECLVEIGCWGPVVNCNIVQRGAINHMGGCMRAGGICIGCTMPGFPDKFSPFYKTPPGAIVSTFAAKSVGAGRPPAATALEPRGQPRAPLGRAAGGAERMGARPGADRDRPDDQVLLQRVAAHGGQEARPAARARRTASGGRTGPGYRSDYLDDSAAREDSDDRR